MSYDITLKYGRKLAKVDKFEEGGTYVLGGTDEATLNITYNYSLFYYSFLDKKMGLRWLYKKKAKNTIIRLKKAIKKLGICQYKDYWADTPGNAGYALSILLEWAKQHPKAVWGG